MALQDTNLIIQMAPIPQTFAGGPVDLAAAMLRRMKIVSPTGTNFIFIGDNEPTSNVGPWLKGGTQWWVWDEDTKRYVPLDISESETTWFWIGTSTPSGTTPAVWLKTDKDPTEASPSIGNPLSWYVYNGTEWAPFNNIVLSGTTANRPAAPVAYQQYYDTTIACLIWYERGAWRTVDGVPGDCKFVAYPTLSEALTANPGWDLFGSSNVSLRGRIPLMAAKNSDGTDPVTVPAGVAQRAAFETFGEGQGIAADSSSSIPYPPEIALWFLTKL